MYLLYVLHLDHLPLLPAYTQLWLTPRKPLRPLDLLKDDLILADHLLSRRLGPVVDIPTGGGGVGSGTRRDHVAVYPRPGNVYYPNKNLLRPLFV